MTRRENERRQAGSELAAHATSSGAVESTNRKRNSVSKKVVQAGYFGEDLEKGD
jgi:hypothetical protein